MKSSRWWLPLLLAALALPRSLAANVILPAIFSNHMVLQQESEVTIWGWAKALEPVAVMASWDSTAVEVTADNRACWQVKLQTPKAGGPYTVTIRGYNEIVLEDVMVGEVWLCSGQSNMEWSARAGIDSAAVEIEHANYPEIRFFQVEHRTAESPQLDIRGEWRVCTPESMIDFSAVAYFFGRRLRTNLGVPIGLINNSWGGTPAETWMNPQVVLEDPTLKKAAARLAEVPWCPVKPGLAYHAMLAPLIPYRIAGVIWYQGEGNTANPTTYHQLFPALIESWRHEWQQEFPFYFVQIAPYRYSTPDAGVLIREAQRLSLQVPNTGMVVTSDIGNIDDIHPRDKLAVGDRLANWALARTYGKSDIAYCGPIYRRMQVEGEKVRLFFDHAENGLRSRGGRLTHFQIAGEDSIFVEAEAKISGSTVIVHSRRVKKPVAVRFAWSNTAEPNLFNAEGLPASCFRTDSWDVMGN